MQRLAGMMKKTEGQMGIKVLNHVTLLFDKPENPKCPRCRKAMEVVKVSGSTWGIEEYPVLWFLPMCEACEEEMREKEIPLPVKLAKVGLVGKLQGMRLDTFKVLNPGHERALKLANRVVQDRDINLWLVGSCGTGKTHVAAGVVRALAGSPVSVRFTYVPSLLDELRDSMKGVWEGELPETVASGVDVLVLDDLGCEKNTEWAVERLTVIADQRSLYKRVTVITSNLDPDEVRFRMGDRMVSRLMENCRVVDMGSEDYRVKGKKKVKK
jgi:DNA replication protein DnaC